MMWSCSTVETCLCFVASLSSAAGRTADLKFPSLHARQLQKSRDMKQIKQHFTESSFIKKLHILKRVKVLLDPSGISKGYIL